MLIDPLAQPSNDGASTKTRRQLMTPCGTGIARFPRLIWLYAATKL